MINSSFILVTRPEEDSKIYSDELRSQGWNPFSESMLKIMPKDFQAPALKKYQALVLTSAHAARIFPVSLEAIDLPVYTVGEQTAQAARARGYRQVIAAEGSGLDLANLLRQSIQDKDLPLLHLRGEDVALSLDDILEPSGIVIESLIVYKAQAAEKFSSKLLKLIDDQQIQAVTFFSRRTALIFIKLVQESGRQNQLKAIKALCLSDAVLECVRSCDWAQTCVADTPDRGGMTALIARVCS